MKLMLFSVRDIKAGVHFRPMAAVSRGEAVRSFGDTVADKNNVIGRHPEDFHLFLVGEFDEVSGEITPVKPEYISQGVDFMLQGGSK